MAELLDRIALTLAGANKCGCAMSAAEMLVANIVHERPKRAILIVDRGNGWDVTQYGPQNAGRPRDYTAPDYVTIQSTTQNVEEMLVRLRREPDMEAGGTIITDPEQIVRELSK